MALISLNIGGMAPAAVPAAQAPVTHKPLELAELGGTGTAIFGGFLRDLGEYNPELSGLNAYPTYERMRRSDAQVAATLMAIKLPIRGAEWTVREPEDASPVEQEATALIRSCLMEELDFDGIIENALLMLDFGAALHEDVYYIDGNQVRLKKLAARLPLTFYRWITEASGDDLAAIEQMGYRGNEYIVRAIPATKLSLFTYQQEGANFAGRSLLRPMYQHWYIKSNLYKVEAIACERNGMGIPWIQMGAAGTSVSTEDRKAAAEWLKRMAVNESTSLVNPPGWTFGLEGVNGTVHSTKDAIEHHNSMLSCAALAQFLNLGQGGSSGNRALGQTMSDFFYLSLQSLANQIARTINLTTVKRLCDFNFTGIVRYPRVLPQQILGVKIEGVIEALKELASDKVAIIQPDEQLENWIREKIGMPAANAPRARQAPIGSTIKLSDGFTPKRAPRGAEKFLALSEMSSELDRSRDAIALILRMARQRIQAEIVHKLIQRPVREAHRVAVELDSKLVAQVVTILENTWAFGAHTITQERSRQSSGKKPATAAAVRAAAKRDPLGVYADGVVSEFTNNLQQRATNVVIDAKRRQGDKTAGQVIIDAGATLDDQSEGWIDNVAAKGANAAFADGRAAGYEEYKDEISEVVYSALLDINTCEQCANSDGDSGATPDDITAVPNPDCDGGDKCRCVHVFVFADEAKAAA